MVRLVIWSIIFILLSFFIPVDYDYVFIIVALVLVGFAYADIREYITKPAYAFYFSAVLALLGGWLEYHGMFIHSYKIVLYTIYLVILCIGIFGTYAVSKL
jgi:hypothetical protein